MSRLPAVSAREVMARLRKAGFRFDRQAKGSHEIWFNASTRRWVTIPVHPGTLPKGTLQAIIREAGLSRDAFLRLGC